MKIEDFDQIVDEVIETIRTSLKEKAKEYMRNNDPLHNFNVGARKKNCIREYVIEGFALKHEISIEDMINDIDKGIIPTKQMVDEKFKDSINYRILTKASIIDRINTINNHKVIN